MPIIIYQIQGTKHRLEVSNEVYVLFEEERKYQERKRKVSYRHVDNRPLDEISGCEITLYKKLFERIEFEETANEMMEILNIYTTKSRRKYL